MNQHNQYLLLVLSGRVIRSWERENCAHDPMKHLQPNTHRPKGRRMTIETFLIILSIYQLLIRPCRLC